MAFPTRLPKVGHRRKHFNEWTWLCYHQAPPLERVVAHVGDAGQAMSHCKHNPLSLLDAWNATRIRQLNDPVGDCLPSYFGPKRGINLRRKHTQRSVQGDYLSEMTLCIRVDGLLYSGRCWA